MRHALIVFGVIVGVGVSGGLAGCGSDSGGSGGSCAGTVTHLRSCGLMTEGEFDCDPTPDEQARCEVGCFSVASCQDLEAVFCGNFGLNPLGECLARCGQFRCANGEIVDANDRCDVTLQCSDGSDERGCAYFQCTSGGTTLAADSQCDGWEECSDGSDEVGCPSFQCGDGETVPLDYKCDGYPDCSTASDEAGCPTFRCTGGDTIPADWQCDGEADCVDGTDEVGCPPRAELICGGQTQPL